MQFKSMRRVAVLGVAVVATVVSLSGGAVAAPTAVVQPSPNTVGSPQIKDGQTYGWDMANNTIPWSKLGSDLRAEIRAANVKAPNAISNTSQIAPDTIDENDLNVALSTKVNTDAGALAKTFIGVPTKIAKIGGPFATNATLVGTVNLQTGTYEAITSAKFDREDATLSNGDPNPDYATPTTDTYPTVALRYGTAGDAGTIMGVPISKAGFVELTQSASKGFTLNGPTVISVYAFGYNEDRSGFGANQITVDVSTMFVKLG